MHGSHPDPDPGDSRLLRFVVFLKYLSRTCQGHVNIGPLLNTNLSPNSRFSRDSRSI